MPRHTFTCVCCTDFLGLKPRLEVYLLLTFVCMRIKAHVYSRNREGYFTREANSNTASITLLYSMLYIMLYIMYNSMLSISLHVPPYLSDCPYCTDGHTRFIRKPAMEGTFPNRIPTSSCITFMPSLWLSQEYKPQCMPWTPAERPETKAKAGQRYGAAKRLLVSYHSMSSRVN